MQSTMTRVKDCPECAGVMKKVWGDMKTRNTALRCLRCENELTVHEKRTTYLELQHADVFSELDTEMDFEAFMSAAEDLDLQSTNEALTPETVWPCTQIALTEGGSYRISCYESRADRGRGVGSDEKLPYGQSAVAAVVDRVYVQNSELEMVPINDGSAWVYFHQVRDIELEDDGRFASIEL